MAADAGQQANVHVSSEAAVLHQGRGPLQAGPHKLLGHVSGCEVGIGELGSPESIRLATGRCVEGVSHEPYLWTGGFNGRPSS